MTTYEQIVSRERKVGRTEGKQLGVKEGRTNTILNGYKKGLPVELLADITELSVKEVRKIIQEHGD